MASNVLSGSNHEGASANAFAVAAVIATPLELTLVDAVAGDDGNDDGDSAGGQNTVAYSPVQPQSTAQLPGWQVPD